jgi:hypothetical protein
MINDSLDCEGQVCLWHEAAVAGSFNDLPQLGKSGCAVGAAVLSARDPNRTLSRFVKHLAARQSGHRRSGTALSSGAKRAF